MSVVRDMPGRGPDRRYLRRRTNRRVRKVRRIRAVGRVALVVASNLAVVSLLGYTAARGLRALAGSPHLELRQIRIEGIERGSRDAVRARIAPALTRNLIDVDLERVAALAATDAWVREATVRRLLPDTLVIRAIERRPAAVALIGGLAHMVDDRGVVLGPTGEGLADDLPVLTGLDRLEGDELAAALARGVRLLEEMRAAAPSWHAEISELDVGRGDRLTARLRGTTARVLLDPERVLRNLDAFLRLRPIVAEHVGAVDYVDLRWSRRVAVMPASTVESR